MTHCCFFLLWHFWGWEKLDACQRSSISFSLVLPQHFHRVEFYVRHAPTSHGEASVCGTDRHIVDEEGYTRAL